MPFHHHLIKKPDAGGDALIAFQLKVALIASDWNLKWRLLLLLLLLPSGWRAWCRPSVLGYIVSNSNTPPSLGAMIPKSSDNMSSGYRILFTFSIFSLSELFKRRPNLAAIPRKYANFYDNQLAFALRQLNTRLDSPFA